MTDEARHHVSDAQLLEHADGELPASANEAVVQHLEACWTCRARLDELQRVIRTVARFRNDLLLPSVPPPPRDWPGLGPALLALDAPPQPSLVDRVRRALWWRVLVSRPAWMLAVTLALALFGWYWNAHRSSAGELLRQAGKAESALVDAPDKAVRRVVLLEEWRERTMAGRRRIETWRRGTVGRPGDTVVVARRVFDEGNRLIAGEWTRADGSRAVYRLGRSPEVVPASVRPALESSEIWRLDASAQEFLALVEGSRHTTVERRDDGFVVRYRPPATDGSRDVRLVEARLTLRRDALRVSEQVLVVLEANTLREYRFAEGALEQLPVARVQPAVFVPEQELLGPPPARPQLAAPVAASLKTPRFTEAALVGMEMAAWQRVHQVGLCTSDQAKVTRSGDGIDVKVAVESETRRDAIRQVLEGFGTPAAVKVEVAVANEASPPATPPADKRAPAHKLLRDHLAGQVVRWSGKTTDKAQANDAALDAAARQMAAWVVERSTRVLAQARALHQEANRWPLATLSSLSLDAVSAWQSMITDHAREIRQEVDLLRGQLEPVFFPDGPPSGGQERLRIQDAAEVPAAAERVLELAKSQHEAVIAAFTPATESGPSARLDGESLLRTWRTLERSADGFTTAWVLLRPEAPTKEEEERSR